VFASSDFGRERLVSIGNTPLLNPDIDASRAILLSQSDYNSFNWRITQWTYLLKMAGYAPFFGYGLGVSASVSTNGLLPHNDYIRALVEGGSVGVLIYLSFLGSQVVYLVRLMRQSLSHASRYKLCFCLLGILLSTLVGMLNENIWSCTAFYFYWWTLMAIVSWDWADPQVGSPGASPNILLKE
jgi:O-antigen ligase